MQNADTMRIVRHRKKKKTRWKTMNNVIRVENADWRCCYEWNEFRSLSLCCVTGEKSIFFIRHIIIILFSRTVYAFT